MLFAFGVPVAKLAFRLCMFERINEPLLFAYVPKTNQNSVSTLKGSYGSCSGRWLIPRFFQWTFSHKTVFVTCPFAFWQGRLAQNLGRHFSAEFLHKTAAPLTFPCACRLRKLAQTAGRNLGLRHVSHRFLHHMAFVTCPCAFRLRRLAQSDSFEILGSPARILVRYSLVLVSMTRSCADLAEILWGFRVWSCTGPYANILCGSWWNPFWEVLAWFCTGPCEEILQTSW